MTQVIFFRFIRTIRIVTIETLSLDHSFNFDKQMDARTFGLPYDYASLMHYEPTAFSINGEPTITPKKAGVEFLSNAKKTDDQVFSELDIKTVRILYSC